MRAASDKPLVAIACGGTGGHLFPGVAVAEELVNRGCKVMLLISPKEVDQQAVKSVSGMQVVVLPAVGLVRGQYLSFLRGFWKSYRTAREIFRKEPPQAVLAMGGFTSAPPVLAGKKMGALGFLHESNAIPGKANRWLAHFVHQAFVGFPVAAYQLFLQNIVTTGTPVRRQFQPGDPGAARIALGLDPKRPVLLVMGGSQGANGINQMLIEALPFLTKQAPEMQYLHLSGPNDVEKVRAAYAANSAAAHVQPFLTEMELALSAATVTVSRAGASSLAEIAAMRLPSILVPYPTAADNHQFHNADAFVKSGAALLLPQTPGSGEKLALMAVGLLRDEHKHRAMAKALEAWHTPHAAELISEKMLLLMNAWHNSSPSTRGKEVFESTELKNLHSAAS